MPIGPSSKFVARRFSPEEENLRDYWNRQHFDNPLVNRSGEVYPVPEHPSIFRGDIPVNDPGLARTAEEFYKIAPNLKNRVSRIMYGPGKVAIGAFRNNDELGPEDFNRSNLLGITSLNTGEINMNPALGLDSAGAYKDYPPEGTLGHEMTHAAGYIGERDATQAERLVRRLRGLPPLKGEIE